MGVKKHFKDFKENPKRRKPQNKTRMTSQMDTETRPKAPEKAYRGNLMNFPAIDRAETK